jgi:hypothetical protein
LSVNEGQVVFTGDYVGEWTLARLEQTLGPPRIGRELLRKTIWLMSADCVYVLPVIPTRILFPDTAMVNVV